MPLKLGLYLRRADRDDLDTIVSWMEDPDFQLFLYGDPARSNRQVREQIIGMIGRSANNALPTGIYLIIENADGPEGLLSFQNISWRNRACSLDLYLGQKEHRAKMVGAIAFFLAMEYAFDELNMHRVGAYIYAFNSASWRIMEFSGAKRELVMKEHVARDGKLHDMYGFGMLRTEYEELRNRFAKRFPDATLAGMLERYAERAEAPDSTA